MSIIDGSDLELSLRRSQDDLVRIFAMGNRRASVSRVSLASSGGKGEVLVKLSSVY